MKPQDPIPTADDIPPALRERWDERRRTYLAVGYTAGDAARLARRDLMKGTGKKAEGGVRHA